MMIGRPCAVQRAHGVRQIDQVVAFQQPPAEVVGQQLPRSGLELGIALLHAPLGRLSVQCDQPLALLREDPEGAVGRAESGPGEALRGHDAAEVGQLLGRRVEATGGDLDRDLLRHETDDAALGKPADRCIFRVVVDRPVRERRLEGRAEHERDECEPGDDSDAGADGGQLATERPVGLVTLPAGQQLEVALAQLGGAGTADAESDRHDRERRKPDDRARVEEHHESVEDRPHPPQESEHQQQEDQAWPVPAKHPGSLCDGKSQRSRRARRSQGLRRARSAGGGCRGAARTPRSDRATTAPRPGRR